MPSQKKLLAKPFVLIVRFLRQRWTPVERERLSNSTHNGRSSSAGPMPPIRIACPLKPDTE